MKLLNNFTHKHTNKNIVAWFTMPQVYQTAYLYTTHAIARLFLPTIFWVLVIRITNKQHVYIGCKIVGNGEQSW